MTNNNKTRFGTLIFEFKTEVLGTENCDDDVGKHTLKCTLVMKHNGQRFDLSNELRHFDEYFDPERIIAFKQS